MTDLTYFQARRVPSSFLLPKRIEDLRADPSPGCDAAFDARLFPDRDIRHGADGEHRRAAHRWRNRHLGAGRYRARRISHSDRSVRRSV